MSRITVMTAGHLSTCPRMLKAADALTRAGHSVRVISTRHVAWATEADREVAQARRYSSWHVIDYDRASAARAYAWTGLRRRLALSVSDRRGPEHARLGVIARAYSRVHSELVKTATAEPCDLFYGGTTGALAATAEAASRARVPFVLDLEDFHSGEQQGADAALVNALAARLERELLPRASALTAAGGAIRDQYEGQYGVSATSVNNTFPLPPLAPSISERRAGDPLRMYWFSQTVGPNRGLEEAIAATGIAGVPAELHLRGRLVDGFEAALQRLAAQTAPELRLFLSPPINPDSMIDSCRPYEIGLATEQPDVPSRDLCLTNKALTYPLAGLAIVVTSTLGQRAFAADLGAGALSYAPGDVQALAAGLRRWFDEPKRLACARSAAWAAAVRRWHWEHPLERDALVRTIEGAMR
jgi:hypothetical protein